MLRLFIVCAVCVISSIGSAVAAPNARALECKAIKDKTKRLKCYDAIEFDEAEKPAVTQQKKKWEKEPSSFLSIAMGEKLDSSVPVSCPTRSNSLLGMQEFDEYKWKKLGSPLCQVKGGAGGVIEGVKIAPSFYVWGTGVEELRRGVRVEVDDDGKVILVSAKFYSSEGASLYDALTKRFGEPTETSATTMILKNGASIPGSSSTWLGEKAVLVFSSHTDREVDRGITDFGKISFTTAAYIDRQLKEQAANTAKKSEKF